MKTFPTSPGALVLASTLLLAVPLQGAEARTRLHHAVRTAAAPCAASHRHHSRLSSCRPRRASKPAGTIHTAAPTHASATTHAAASPGKLATTPATCTNTGLIPDSGNVAQVAAATLCLVNQQRAASGEGPLMPDPSLTRIAQAHTVDMVSVNFFDHASSNGTSSDARILASGFFPAGSGYTLGENIAMSTGALATPAATVDSWMHSPEHRANILNREFTSSGIGVLAAVPASYDSAGEPGATFTQDFDAILD